MSQKELISLLQSLSDNLPNNSVADSEHLQRIDEMIESLEAQAVAENTGESIDDTTGLNNLVMDLMENYQNEHPKSASILMAIKTTLSNVL